MTTETISIQVREDGSRVVTRNISGIGDAADKSASSVDFLKRTLATVVTGATLVQLAKLADQYTTIQNQLRVVTTGTENLARVTKELQSVANATRSDFTATAELYAKLANTTKDLGIGQQQLLDFTKSLNQAIVLSGASAEEAAGGIRQLAQGMASGTLRGDELNSVLENLPVVADVISKSLGITRGELRKMGAEGKITAETILTAFEQAKGSLEQGFATTVPTLGQSLTVLKNNFITFIGEADQAYGITSKLANIILTLANNMDTFVPILVAVGAGIAAAFVPSLIASFTAQIKALWLVLQANPWVAIATAVASVIVAVTLLRDEIKLGIDDTTTLGDLMRAAWETIAPAIDFVRQAASSFFAWIRSESDDTSVVLIKNGQAVGQAQEATWLKILRTVAQVFDMIGGVVRGTMHGVYNVIAGVVNAAINSFEQLGTAAAAALSGDWDTVIAATKSSKAGLQAGLDIGGNFMKGFNEEILAQGDSGLEATLDQWIKRAQEIGKERAAAATAEGQLNPSGGGRKPSGGDSDAKKAARELAQLQNALQNVLDAANPLEAAQRQLAEAQDILNKAVSRGLISAEAAGQAYADLQEMMRDQLDPLGALNRELDRNIELMKIGAEQRQIEGDMMVMIDRLRRDGVKLTEEETAQLRAKLTVEQELARIAQIRDDLERNSQARRSRDASEQISTAGEQVRSGAITQGDAINSLAGSMPGLDKTQEYFDAQLEQLTAYYEQVEAMRQEELISEETASQLRMQIFSMEQAQKLSMTEQTLGAISSLMLSSNKKAFAVGKAAAIAQAVVNTYLSATKAMAEVPYPANFIAAGAAVVAGLANVAKIRSQQPPQYRTGGSFVVGGHGGQDSQDVHLRATPGERININTPAQARALERMGDEDRNIVGRRPVAGPTTVVVNVQGIIGRDTPTQIGRNVRREQQKNFERSGVK